MWIEVSSSTTSEFKGPLSSLLRVELLDGSKWILVVRPLQTLIPAANHVGGAEGLLVVGVALLLPVHVDVSDLGTK